MGFSSPNLWDVCMWDVWSGHIAWAPAAAGTAARTPCRCHPPHLPLAPDLRGGVAPSQVELYLSSLATKRVVLSGHPSWRSLILGNECSQPTAPRYPFLPGTEASAIQWVDFMAVTEMHLGISWGKILYRHVVHRLIIYLSKTPATCMFWNRCVLCKYLSIMPLVLYILLATCH